GCTLRTGVAGCALRTVRTLRTVTAGGSLCTGGTGCTLCTLRSDDVGDLSVMAADPLINEAGGVVEIEITVDTDRVARRAIAIAPYRTGGSSATLRTSCTLCTVAAVRAGSTLCTIGS